MERYRGVERRNNPIVCLSEQQMREIALIAAEEALKSLDSVLINRLTELLDREIGRLIRQKIISMFMLIGGGMLAYLVAKGYIKIP